MKDHIIVRDTHLPNSKEYAIVKRKIEVNKIYGHDMASDVSGMTVINYCKNSGCDYASTSRSLGEVPKCRNPKHLDTITNVDIYYHWSKNPKNATKINESDFWGISKHLSNLLQTKPLRTYNFHIEKIK